MARKRIEEGWYQRKPRGHRGGEHTRFGGTRYRIIAVKPSEISCSVFWPISNAPNHSVLRKQAITQPCTAHTHPRRAHTHAPLPFLSQHGHGHVRETGTHL